MEVNRINWIDIAKGMAIIFVVIGHVVASYHNVHLYEDSFLFNFSNQFVYSFHMALFMMLSGILVGKQAKQGRRGGYYSKIIAYGIPYVAFSFVLWSFKMIFSNNVNKTLTFQDLFLIPIYPISFMWFLYALLIMVLVQICIGGHKSQTFKACHVMLALILFLIRPYLGDALEFIRFNDLVVSDVMKNYVYFLLGVYGSQLILSTKQKRPFLFIVFGVLLIAGNVAKYLQIGFTQSSVFKLIIAIVGSYCIMLLSQILSKSRILEYLGKNSLPIYVLHGICIAVVRLGLNAVTHDEMLNEWLAWLVCVLLGTIIPLFIYWLSCRIWKFDFVFRPTKYIKC